MKGEIVCFGQVEPSRLLEKHLIGIETGDQKGFELHEIVTKVATGSDHADIIVCRSFTEPEKVKTISFWTDLDKQIFIPEKKSSIFDFVHILPSSSPSSDASAADISNIPYKGSKFLVFYAEKTMSSGNIKLVLIQRAGKYFEMYECMSGKKPRYNVGHKLYSQGEVDRNVKRLEKLGYKVKQLPADEA